MHTLSIILLTIFSAVVYGIIHDQVTARICVEYFTVFHPPVFHTNSPTLLGFGWGVIATWWVGAMLGVPLAIAARFGSRPQRDARFLLRPILILLLAMGLIATMAGLTGYLLASRGIVPMPADFAEALPPEKHARFMADLWAHNASYLSGFLGGIVLIVATWRSRGEMRKPV